MKSRRKKCLFILGMHRGGTSAMAGIFHCLGFDVGEGLMPANYDNPKGYFENWNCVRINDRILKMLGISWDYIGPMRENWWLDSGFDAIKREIYDVINNYYHGNYIVIKDPRLSYTLPIWQCVLDHHHIQSEYIITVRKIVDVAASLNKRDGFPFNKSALLWANYMINGERFTRDRPRSFVRFNKLVEDPIATLELLHSSIRNVIKPTVTENNKEIVSFIEPSLHHHSTNLPAKEFSIPSYLKRIENILTKIPVTAELRDDQVSLLDNCYSQHDDNLLFYHGPTEKKFQAKLFAKRNGEILRDRVEFKDISIGAYELQFDLKLTEKVDELVFIPSTEPVVLKIYTIQIRLNDDKLIQHEAKNIAVNKMVCAHVAHFKSNETISIELGGLEVVEDVKIDCEYFAFGDKMYEYLLGCYRDNYDKFDTNDEISTQLFVDTGEGFNEQESITKSHLINQQELHFDLDHFQSPVGSLRLDPCERMCVVEMKNLKVLTEDGIIENYSLAHNGHVDWINQFYIFFSQDPSFILNLHQEVIVKKFSVHLIIHAVGDEIIGYLKDQVDTSYRMFLSTEKSSSQKIQKVMVESFRGAELISSLKEKEESNRNTIEILNKKVVESNAKLLQQSERIKDLTNRLKDVAEEKVLIKTRLRNVQADFKKLERTYEKLANSNKRKRSEIKALNLEIRHLNEQIIMVQKHLDASNYTLNQKNETLDMYKKSLYAARNRFGLKLLNILQLPFTWINTHSKRVSNGSLVQVVVDYRLDKVSLHHDQQLIRSSGLFDEKYYLNEYPDTKGIDGIRHYLLHGANENRNPSKDFNTAEYFNMYPELLDRNINPLVHFISNNKALNE